MGSHKDHLRVWAERGARWVLDQYRSQNIRDLVYRARLTAAQLLMPPDAVPRSTSQRESAPRVEPEAGLHVAVAGMSADVALRDLTLVDSLLAQLEGMEAREGDPDALARLYQLDHLAARMRRNAENLRVLVGRDAGSASSAPSLLIDVIRAAMSSIEQYRRITIGRVAALAVVDAAADDLSRLLAELLDNAASYSPQTSTVAVNARLTTQGSILVFIEDAGRGISLDRRQAFGAQFHTASSASIEPAEQTGLAVVYRLAIKHGIRVRLDTPGNQGTTAVVLLPATLLCEPPATPWFADTPAVRTPPPAPAPIPAQVQVEESAPAAGPSPGSPETTTRTRARRTTRNGLPRREPHSLREFASFALTVPHPRKELDSDRGEAREQLLTDLDDFSAGERAARAPRPGSPE